MARKGEELVATKFSKRFEDYNTKVLEELADIISKFKELTPSQARKLGQQLKYDRSYTELLDELSKLTGKTKKEIKGILEEVARQDIEFADIYFKARKMDTPVLENTKELTNIIDTALKMSEGDFVNLAKSTGFAFLDKNNHIMFLDMKDTYYKVIDECIYAISQGKESYNTMINKTIDQLVDSGVRKIVYTNDNKKQYTQRIETAVRRNIMDSMRQVSMETSMELGKRFDADGVEISVHPNPAPDHMYVQGHQFRMEEFEKFQNDMDSEDVNGVKFPATSTETGRDRRSIGQYNCYHYIRQIIVGIDKPLFSNEQLQAIIEANNKGVEYEGKHYTLYEMTQLQRQIETEIRKNKDKHIFYKQLDDKSKLLKTQKTINQLQNKYKEVTKIANLRDELIERARVKGYKRVSVNNLQEKPIEYKDYNNEKSINILENQTKNLYNKLTEEEISDLNGYTLTDFLDLNEYLANKRVRSISDFNKEQLNSKIKNIDSAMNKSIINDNMLVYKGTDNSLFSDLKTGDELEIPIYYSTTIKSGITEKFARHHNDPAILEIRVPKGTKGIYMSDVFNENGINEFEVLLNRNLKYKLVNSEFIETDKPIQYKNKEGVWTYKNFKYTKYILEVIK